MKSNRIASVDDKRQVIISRDKGQVIMSRDKGHVTTLRTNNTRDMTSHSGSELESDAHGQATSSSTRCIYDQGLIDVKAYFQKYNLILGTLMVWAITLVLPLIGHILGNRIELS